MDTCLTENERRRRRELLQRTRDALGAGQTLEEFDAAREEKTAQWADAFHSAMEWVGTDNPVEVLPLMTAMLEQRMLAVARAAGEKIARAEVERMLRRAIAP